VSIEALKQYFVNRSNAAKTAVNVEVLGRNTEVVQEGTATTDAGTGLAFDVQYLGLLINDSTTINLLFSFDGVNYKTLKPSEYIGDMAISATKLYVKSASSTVAFRAWGWK